MKVGRCLFDGRTTDGWHNYNSDQSWWVGKSVHGELIALGASEQGSDIVTNEEYENFELVMLSGKSAEKGNSGIFFNVVEDPGFTFTCIIRDQSINWLDNDRYKDAARTIK